MGRYRSKQVCFCAPGKARSFIPQQSHWEHCDCTTQISVHTCLRESEIQIVLHSGRSVVSVAKPASQNKMKTFQVSYRN